MSNTQLLAVTEHLHYEVEMLKQTANRLLPNPARGFDPNILLESFATHARALAHFFYPDNACKTDPLIRSVPLSATSNRHQCLHDDQTRTSASWHLYYALVAKANH